MTETVRLLLLLAMAGALVTFVGSFVLWWGDERRRLTRALTRVLKAPPEAMILAAGRGRAAGFNFNAGNLAVAWDKGSWCLIYRIGELMGAELIVDGHVAARVQRGEGRRALEQTVSSAAQVTLRLIFDDARNPDFDLDLWRMGDEARHDAGSPADAITEANRWIARIEAILRHTSPPVAQASAQPPAPAPQAPIAPPRVAAPPPPPPPPPPPEPEWEPEPEPPEPTYAAPPPRPAAQPKPRARPPAPPPEPGLFDQLEDEDDDPPWQPDLLGDRHN